MDQEQFFRRVIDILEQMQMSYMVVGSYASTRYGEPRYTQHIDIFARFESEDLPVLDRAFPQPDYYFNIDAARDAMNRGTQFKVIHSSGNKVDFMIARGDLWGREQLSRRQRVHFFPDCEASIATPEDIIISKMRYYKESNHDRHLSDIHAMLISQGEKVNQEYVNRWSREFGLMEIWTTILARIEQSQ